MNTNTNATQATGTTKTEPRHERRSYTWVFEVLVAITVAPALIYALASLNDLPIV